MEEDQKPTEAENQSSIPAEAEEAEGLEGVDLEDGTEEETQEKTQQEKTEQPQDIEKVTKGFSKKIDKLTAQRYKERRKSEELEAKLKEAEAKLNQFKQKSEQIKIPPVPDPLDHNFAQKMSEREQAIREAERINASKQFEAQQQKQLAHEKMKREQEEIYKNHDQMFLNATKYGIPQEELKAAEEQVSVFIRDPNLARFVLAQEKAPLIVKYLSTNYEEMEKIGSMSPLYAAAYISTNIMPNAEKLKPKLPTAPKPLEIPKGKAAKQQSQFLEGVEFE